MSNKTKITACQNFLLDGSGNLAQEGQERSTTTNGRLLDSSCCDRPQYHFDIPLIC
jgi:hypothetical protein